jgi:hypothetical protein
MYTEKEFQRPISCLLITSWMLLSSYWTLPGSQYDLIRHNTEHSRRNNFYCSICLYIRVPVLPTRCHGLSSINAMCNTPYAKIRYYSSAGYILTKSSDISSDISLERLSADTISIVLAESTSLNVSTIE